MIKRILIIDGQGGRIGKQLAQAALETFPTTELFAVGTNSIATSNMIKAGVQHAATGENAVLVAARKADVIVGPIGIVIADALMGEITPQMAVAVGQSRARKVLLPINRCENRIVGVPDLSITELLKQAMTEIGACLCEDSSLS